MRKIRTAILGCGNFAHVHAKNLVDLEEDVALVAFCDQHMENALAYQNQYSHGKAMVFDDYRSLIEDAGLDLLVVTLPPFAHTDEIASAAAQGINVFIEKPIALTTEHAWQMVHALEAAGVKSQVGFMYRFGKAVEQVKEMLTAGEVGRPGLMSARYFCNALHASWWRDKEKSGGQLVEQAIHMIDLMRYLMGEPVSVFSRQENLFHQDVPGYTIEDVSSTIYSFENGTLGTIYATNAAIPGRWIHDFRLVAEKLTIDFSGANEAALYFTDQQPVRTKFIQSERNIHLFEMLDLIHAIKTGVSTRTPIRDGALSLEMALGATRSAEIRQEVFFKQ